MSIWGKIIGGAAGFAIGGPLGAMLGAGVGHAMDTGLASGVGRAAEDATRKITFTIGVIALSAKMAKADGVVTRDEVDAFREIFKIPPHEAKNVGRVFDMARKDVAGYETYAKQVADLFKNNQPVLEDLLGALFHIAKADGTIHPDELKFLKNVAMIFGFTEECYASLKAQYLGEDAADPYVILKVQRDVSNADLKKAYYALIKEHHPDRLMAEGLPEEFLDIANEKLAAINGAYDRINNERSI
ncbi:MAG: TerB family tellurite resistance protein [Sphingomonadales bacterium]|nr:TerB family tellurite resistance protein [Sphingomonadales bacterium]